MIPNWLYRKCDISHEELNLLQQEIIPNLDKILPGCYDKPGNFYRAEHEIVKNISPTLNKFLTRLNLYHKWTYSALSIGNNKVDNLWKIHTDDPDFNRCIALNIPILNCENTFTVWYDVSSFDGTTKNDTPEKLSDSYKGASFFDESISKEIGRLGAHECAFVNVATPHKPEINHNDLRVVLSCRFWPEIFDYFETVEK